MDFAKKHGTNMALIVLGDEILKTLDEGKIVLGVFLDLSKAFDTVDHSILLQKYLNMALKLPLLNG